MKLNLKQIEAFVWVTYLGSFRKAAARLHTTQPNISGRISALETALDARLMERDAGSVRLTSQGQKLLTYARKVIFSVDELIDAADQNILLNSTLKLGVTEMVVNTWLRDFLKRLKELYPEVIVELTVDVSVKIEQELTARSIDLALQNEPFIYQTTGNVDLGTYPIIWVASPALNLHKNKSVTPDEMSTHPILTHSRDTRLYEEVSNHFIQRKPHTRLVPSSNLAASLHMATDAMGVASVPAVMVAEELESGELVQIHYPWTPESLHFLARYDVESAPRLIVKAAQIAGEVAKDNN